MTTGMTIKGRFLLSVFIVVILSSLCMGVYSYRSQVAQLLLRFEDLAEQQNRLFETILNADAEGLRRATVGLSRLKTLREPLATRDRQALLAVAAPLFNELKSKSAITHMYFIAPDGTVLLRAHRPEQYGDHLTRATFLQAAATRETASGLEMGKNFFSLRCVAPVFDGSTLLGYLEVAEEIDHIFVQMKKITGADIALFLPRHYIEQYETNLTIQPGSDFPPLYPSTTLLFMPAATNASKFLAEGLHGFVVKPSEHGSANYAVGIGPIKDAFGKTAGVLFSQVDISQHYVAIWRGVLTSLAFFVGILIAGNWLLYFSMRKSMGFFMAVREHIQRVTRTWDLEQRIDVVTADEIGDLAEDINLMQSEISKLKSSLLKQTEELAAANQDLESFSYTLSHDLRVPLTRAYAAVQLLEEGYGDQLDEDGRSLLQNISKGCEGMEDLIEAILVLTNIVRKEICTESVDLSELAWDIVEELRTGDPARTVEIVIPDQLICEGDRQLLRVALRDLYENAWKYTGTATKPRIEFGTVEQHGKPAYYLRDNGIGFDMQQAEKLFVPFKRLSNARSYPGTGIGLATVAKIMLRHGGNIWAVGHEGQGATFYFTLPPKPLS